MTNVMSSEDALRQAVERLGHLSLLPLDSMIETLI